MSALWIEVDLELVLLEDPARPSLVDVSAGPRGVDRHPRPPERHRARRWRRRRLARADLEAELARDRFHRLSRDAGHRHLRRPVEREAPAGLESRFIAVAVSAPVYSNVNRGAGARDAAACAAGRPSIRDSGGATGGARTKLSSTPKSSPSDHAVTS